MHLIYPHKGVDPRFERNFLIYCDEVDDLLYDVTLNYVDIVTNKNSFFRLQLLQTAAENLNASQAYTYVLRQSKGRIGTVIGSKQLTVCKDVDEAKMKFKEEFLQKTGNRFGEVEFEKKAGQFYQLQIDYADVRRKIPWNNVPTKLTKALYELMQLLVNDTVMKSTLLAYCSGDESMPLGKITMQQIDDASNVLAELALMLNHNDVQRHQILAASNQFYSYVPHHTRLRRPPIIDTPQMVQQKMKLLQNMSENCTKYDILTSELNDERNLYDVCYEHLGRSVQIKMINKASAMYAEIEKYMRNTQLLTDFNPSANSARRNKNGFEINEVFEVTRHDEVLNFKPYELQQDRYLLFHGSPIVNFFNILTNGLKISPPEAALHGAVFGKGIYFTDSVTKAAAYSHASKGIGLVLLCEVSLGGCLDSLKAEGKHRPSETTVCSDGLKIPNGRLVTEEGPGIYINFNEYVLFDPKRVKIRYLVKFS